MPNILNPMESAGFTYQLQKIRNFLLLVSTEVEDTNYVWTLDENNDVTLIYYLGKYPNIKVPTMVTGIVSSPSSFSD